MVRPVDARRPVIRRGRSTGRDGSAATSGALGANGCGAKRTPTATRSVRMNDK
jgi:hypothetical protein